MAKNKQKQNNPKSTFMASSTIPSQAPETTQDSNQRQKAKEDTENFTRAMHLVNASVVPMALKAAIDLGVFDILANTEDPQVGLTAAEIAHRIPTQNNPDAPGMIERILRLLAGHGVAYGVSKFYDDEAPTKYRLGPVGEYFVRDRNGVSLAPLMALTHDKVFLESWSHLKDAIVEGGTPFGRAHGMQLFEYPARDARFSQVYNTAMANHTALVFNKLLENYRGLENLKQVVDVGGGIGVALGIITSKYPSIKGINFDLPYVIQYAPPYPGVQHLEGDMFKSVPKGDAIILKWILHDWDDEHCLKLLKNCHSALPVGGKVIVVEQILGTVVDDASAATDKFQGDMLSLAQTSGGKERKQHELFGLAFSAGFESVGLGSHVHHYIVMEFLK